MSRYHFHLENYGGLVRDEDGQELADDDAAIAEAGRALATTIGEDVSQQHSPATITITVERVDGSRVATVTATSRIDRA